MVRPIAGQLRVNRPPGGWGLGAGGWRRGGDGGGDGDGGWGGGGGGDGGGGGGGGRGWGLGTGALTRYQCWNMRPFTLTVGRISAFVLISWWMVFCCMRDTVDGSTLTAWMGANAADDCDMACSACGVPVYDAAIAKYRLPRFCQNRTGDYPVQVQLSGAALDGLLGAALSVVVEPSAIDQDASRVLPSKALTAATEPLQSSVNEQLQFYIQLRDTFSNVIRASADVLVFFQLTVTRHEEGGEPQEVDGLEIFVDGDPTFGFYITTFRTSRSMGGSVRLGVAHSTTVGTTLLGRYTGGSSSNQEEGLPPGTYPLEVSCSEGYTLAASGGCECQPGYAGTPCVKCGPGLYQALPGQASCVACPQSSEANNGGTACTCLSNFYNANPDAAAVVECRLCPDNAECGNNLITPLPGFWHRHPLSPQVSKCLSPGACMCTTNPGGATDASATALKDRFTADIGAVLAVSCPSNGTACGSLEECPLNSAICRLPASSWPACVSGLETQSCGAIALDEGWWACDSEVRSAALRASHAAVLLDDYPALAASDWQCGPGYTGPLCSICKEGYGRSKGFECARCPSDVWTNHMKYALSVALQVGRASQPAPTLAQLSL